jgi:hypothetical protein
MSYRKIGGIRFLTLGRLQFSFCIRRRRRTLIELYHGGAQ